MRFLSYMKSLIETDTGNSSKSFALVISTIMSFIVSMFMCCILAYDAYCNGYIKTDLESAGIFMICVGSCVAASGVPKIFGERSSRRVNEFEDESHNKRRRNFYGSSGEGCEDVNTLEN